MSIIIIKWRFSARKSEREKNLDVIAKMTRKSGRENLDGKSGREKNLDVISQKTRRHFSKLDVISQNSTLSLKSRRIFSKLTSSLKTGRFMALVACHTYEAYFIKL